MNIEKLREHDGNLPKQLEMLRMSTVNYGTPQCTRVVDETQCQIWGIHAADAIHRTIEFKELHFEIAAS
jgi:hypothetical protein